MRSANATTTKSSGHTNAEEAVQDILIRAIAVIGLVWYYICVFQLGLKPTPKDKQPNGFRQFQALSVTTISVSLATYVGFVIGLKGTSHIPAPAGQAAAGAASSPASAAANSFFSSATFADLQWWSAGLYVLSLALALWFYSRTQDDTEPAITGLAKSLLGFVAGVLSIALNVPGGA
jgi:uncharacterized membrane protein YfcA